MRPRAELLEILTTSDYPPRLRARLVVQDQLISDATARGWAGEVERHKAIRGRIEQLLTELGAVAAQPDDLSASEVTGARDGGGA